MATTLVSFAALAYAEAPTTCCVAVIVMVLALRYAGVNYIFGFLVVYVK